MRQLTQKLKEGKLRVIDVPEPVLNAGQVLVRVHHSVISAGTESSTVSAARKGYVGKVKERPEQFKQVIESLKQKGPVQTYRAVMKKLDAHSPLGYSCAGEVVEVASDVRGFSPGDLAACGGAGYANHAEYVAVPTNLCVKLPSDANLEFAAYNTVGAIALQGIRQADLRLGETCVVVGLGLLGQLTCLMLRASGVTAVGIDIRPEAVDVAREHSADHAYTTEEAGLEEKLFEITGGIGADAAIITAASSSEGPVNMAGRLSKKKGRVVIVGRVPTSFDQDTYYKKELDLRMSCSYGPGRYDINYEERGIDYPASYVRWTENRNMRAFQQLLSSGRIDPGFLTTHRFKLEDAPGAYDIILGRNEDYLGILIDFDVEKKRGRPKVELSAAAPSGKVNVAFIGAGSYAMNNLLPNIKGDDVVLKGVMTATGTSARSVADRYGFQFCTADENDVWGDKDINTVFIATRHDSHARYVLKAIEEGRNAFVEKPLCLREEELDEITAAVEKLSAEGGSAALMVGYNRRFSPLTVALKDLVGSGPMSMIYRVNAGAMPADQWMQQPDIGGGRIIGEACHFIDYMIFMCGALPVEVHATVMDEPEHLEDTVNVNLRFADGSIGVVSYLANGPSSLFKEYIEIYRAGSAGIIRDFKELETYGSKTGRKRLPGQNKGQPQMMKAFLDSIRNGTPPPIPYAELEAGTRATFKAIESFRSSKAIAL
ncbi:MAG: bi-domain-containing oxidoreductase [Candidatus Eisenbacteria bacterium]